MPKRSIRQKLLKQRRLLEVGECRRQSRMIQRQLLGTAAYRHASVVALYAPIDHEVETADIFRAALHARKRVCFPRVKDRSLEFVEVAGPASLEPGAFGVAEPVGNAALATESIDLIVVPGVGFDRYGYRLGYGQGYYDRAVGCGSSAILAGLAYDFQVVDKLPAEDHDICLDLLVMDSAVLVFGNIKQKSRY